MAEGLRPTLSGVFKTVFVGVTAGGYHKILPAEGLGITDNNRGLHTNLSIRHFIQAGDGYFFVYPAGGGDNPHRGLGAAVGHD